MGESGAGQPEQDTHFPGPAGQVSSNLFRQRQVDAQMVTRPSPGHRNQKAGAASGLSSRAPATSPLLTGSPGRDACTEWEHGSGDLQ